MSKAKPSMDWERLMYIAITALVGTGVLNNGNILDSTKQDRLEAEFDNESPDELRRDIDRLERHVADLERRLEQ